MFSYKRTFYPNETNWSVMLYSVFSSCINASWALFTYSCQFAGAILLLPSFELNCMAEPKSVSIPYCWIFEYFQFFSNLLLSTSLYRSLPLLLWLSPKNGIVGSKKYAKCSAFDAGPQIVFQKAYQFTPLFLCFIKTFFPITKIVHIHYRQNTDKQLERCKEPRIPGYNFVTPLGRIRPVFV